VIKKKNHLRFVCELFLEGKAQITAMWAINCKWKKEKHTHKRGVGFVFA
jgi:hypothetical protein